MSLTSFVRNEDVRERIDEEFPNQGERASGSILVEQRAEHPALVGTAFDYLTRWWLRRQATECSSRPWVAETSLELARRRFPGQVEEIENVIERANRHMEEYLTDGELTRPLVESALDLGRVDSVYRSGRSPEGIGSYDEGNVQDCEALFEVLETSDDLVGDRVVLNPAFGIASTLVAGADADALVDGTLVDVKTSKSATFKVGYWRQLVGYLVLADVHVDFEPHYDAIGWEGDPNCAPLPEIDDFGVYFARYDELVTVSAESIIYEAASYDSFKSWFVHRALEEYETPSDESDRLVRRMASG